MRKRKNIQNMLDNILARKQADQTNKEYDRFVLWFDSNKSNKILLEYSLLLYTLLLNLKDSNIPDDDKHNVSFCLGYWVGINEHRS